MTLVLTTLAVFLMVYAALAALTWVRRLTGERPARRRAMALNLARRAGPPAIAGLAILVARATLDNGIPVAPGLILIGGGLAFGLHKGLDELRQNDWRSIAPRAALSLAAATGYIWLAGLATG
jgi:hypothetical protein